jgi:SAM-dependent methyltransferase
MPWYEDWFDSDAYELVYDGRDLSEARRLADLVERTVRPAAGARVLDVGCGRGRHARILAARGYRVTGIDLSPRAVHTARRRAADEGVDDRARFEQGDMRRLDYDAAFDGAVNLFTSFGYFDAAADHQAAIDGIARALVPDGWFVQDFLNAPYVRAHLVPEDEKTVDPDGSGRAVRVRQERWLEGDRVRKRITFHRNGDGRDEPPSYTESVRLLTLDDFRRMYAAAGLALTDTFGDYGGARHTPASPRLILCARKRGAGH